MKRYFISGFITFLAIGLLFFLFKALADSNLAYWGAFVSAFGGVFYFVGIYTFYKVPRTPKNLWAFSAVVYSGLLMVLSSLYLNPIPEHYFGLLFAATNLFLWDRYVNWYSVYPVKEKKLDMGIVLPNGNLTRVNGEDVAVKVLIKKPAIWLFYRGNWCPFCMAQVKEMVDNYKEITNLGYQIIFVGSQSASKNSALSDKFKITAEFLTDKNHAYGNKIGLLDKSGLPLGLEVLGYEKDVYQPAVMVTDKNGVVRYLNIADNYRIRPEPKEFLEILNKQ